MNLPLHAPAIRPLDLEKLKNWMTPDMKYRFEEVWSLLTSPMLNKNHVDLNPVSKRSISEQDIRNLVKSEIIHRVSYEDLEKRPTQDQVIPFSTYEERETGARRRFICWPKYHNQALENLYSARVPIGQPVSYVNKITHERAMKRDLKAGFFQIELPKAARAFYRFRYGASTYEMTRMPMGHACAPEIQQILTSTLAGHDGYSLNSLKSHGFNTQQLDIYLDGIRYCGTKDEVDIYERFVDNRAYETNMTFKQEESANTTEYEFLGVHYNHSSKQYKLCDRFLRKIPPGIASHAPLHIYESLCARLVYASEIHAEGLPGNIYTDNIYE